MEHCYRLFTSDNVELVGVRPRRRIAGSEACKNGALEALERWHYLIILPEMTRGRGTRQVGRDVVFA